MHRKRTINSGRNKDGSNKRAMARSLEKVNGIDRKDNSLGYLLPNCVSCCVTCNFLKNMMSANQFIDHVLKIAMHKHKDVIK